MTGCIDLNADLGEGFGAYSLGDDAALMEIISSANVACGFHAGDPLVIKRTVRAARKAGVGVGAHPSFPDLQGFGRRPMQMDPAEVEALICYQIGALAGVARSEDMPLSHVKPHGALNNMAAVDDVLADAVARGVASVDGDLILLAPATSRLSEAGRRCGLRVAEEVFADRAYGDDGQLVPRSRPGAVIHDPDRCVERVLAFLDAGGIVTESGRRLPTAIHSVCVHGDTPDALAISAAVRAGIEAAGLRIAPLPDFL